MDTKTQHAPTPYRVEEFDWDTKLARTPKGQEVVRIGIFGAAFEVASVGLYVGRYPQRLEDNGLTFRKEEAKATADFIVRACNSHEEMLSVLERLAEKVSRANAIQHSGGTIEPEDWSELYMLQNKAKAVIAKATA